MTTDDRLFERAGTGRSSADVPAWLFDATVEGRPPDLSQAYQEAHYDPTVLPPSGGVYDLGDVRRHEVEIPSDGLVLAGHVYLPPTWQQGVAHPTVVVDAPGSSVKEITVPVCAIRMARRGYVVVAFDRRGYGASEGVPQQMDPPNDIRDIRNVTTFALDRPDVDARRLGLLGICMGGGLVVQAAAFDRRYGAVAAVAGHFTVTQMTRDAMPTEDWRAALHAQSQELLADLRAGDPRRGRANAAPADPPESAISVSPEAYDFYTSRQALVGPRWRNEMTYETLLNLAAFDSIPYAALVSATPLLIVHGTIDPLSPGRYAQATYDRASAPKRLVWVETTNHSQLYDREPYITQATDELLAWFAAHLG